MEAVKLAALGSRACTGLSWADSLHEMHIYELVQAQSYDSSSTVLLEQQNAVSLAGWKQDDDGVPAQTHGSHTSGDVHAGRSAAAVSSWDDAAELTGSDAVVEETGALGSWGTGTDTQANSMASMDGDGDEGATFTSSNSSSTGTEDDVAHTKQWIRDNAQGIALDGHRPVSVVIGEGAMPYAT